jgi:bifunctional non-homologous end joining protein LigD
LPLSPSVVATRASVLPKIDPIIPVLSKTLPRGAGWVYELKLDGFRGVLTIEKNGGWFMSKARRRMARFADLANDIARTLDVDDAIFDGEIVVLGDTGPDFYALMQARGTPSYAAFDLLWLNGRDLRTQPLRKRKTELHRFVKTHNEIGYVEAVRSPSLFEAAARLDLEGIIAKRRDDPYDVTTRWVKVKNAEYSQMEGRADLFHRPR